MAIKPSPTIAGKLRKLFSNNKQTIEPAIGDSAPGGGGASPVIVTLQDDTWSGATWAELLNAFNHGCAFINHGKVISNITGAQTFGGNITNLYEQKMSVTAGEVALSETFLYPDGSSEYEETAYPQSP